MGLLNTSILVVVAAAIGAAFFPAPHGYAPLKPGASFSPYDLAVNAAGPTAVPLLVSLGPYLQPVYQVADDFFATHARAADRPSNSYQPVVVFCSRTVKDVESYKTAFSAFAEKAQADGPGVRALFSFMDREKDNTALQFSWFDSAADYVSQPASLEYAGSADEDYCQVWGSWDDKVKEGISGPGLKSGFVKEMRGFIKEPSPANGPGFTTGSPPMIWISKRNVKPGRMTACGTNFQYGTDLMYGAAPAALGICEYTSDDNPDALWSLRVFNDFNEGFKKHFPVPSWILFRMAFNVIPEWMPGLFPIGFSFSSSEYISMAVQANGGNKAYKQYLWDTDRIGPMPDFGKGF